MKYFLAREWCLLTRNRNALWQPLLFFILIVALFPMGIVPDPKILQSIGSGVIWMAVLLSVLMNLPNLFVQELQDGSVEQWILADESMSLRLFCKLIIWWLFFSLPLLVISPLLALLYHFNTEMIIALLLTEILATPILWWLGGLVSALTASLNQASLLLVLLLMPLYVPVLIFASAAVTAAMQHMAYTGLLALLAAMALLLFFIVPLLMSSLLRLAVRFG